MTDIPVVLLSHRKQAFLESTLASLKARAEGLGKITIVDDSGDDEHHQWLCDNNYQFSVVDPAGNAGYLAAMQRVFEVATHEADYAGVDYALLWEEDFRLTTNLDVADMVQIMNSEPELAQLNLQRQAVYRIERAMGYLESHQRRGYGLTRLTTAGMPWVRRQRPFTTNPGLIHRDALSVYWPTREEADAVKGGAEPAMSLKLERQGWEFGWFGRWNQRQVLHVGAEHKTGTGY